MEKYRLAVPAAGRGKAISPYLSGLIRRGIAETRDLVSFGAVYVNGRVFMDPDALLEGGEEILVTIASYGAKRFYEVDPGRILYEDQWLLAYDKEAGTPSQQVPHDAYNNLYHGLMRHLDGYIALHHRLDRDVSGVMLFCRDRGLNHAVGDLFREGRIEKVYLAVVSGPAASETWSVGMPIAKRDGRYLCVEDGMGKPARTDFEVLRRMEGRTLVRARPRTGRTHQIRLHLAVGGNPIVGDERYGGPPGPRLMLHGSALEFRHPATKTPLRIEAPLPGDWRGQSPP